MRLEVNQAVVDKRHNQPFWPSSPPCLRPWGGQALPPPHPRPRPTAASPAPSRAATGWLPSSNVLLPPRVIPRHLQAQLTTDPGPASAPCWLSQLGGCQLQGRELGVEGETRQRTRPGLGSARQGQEVGCSASQINSSLAASGRLLASSGLSFPIYKRTNIHTHVFMTTDTHGHFSGWESLGLELHGESGLGGSLVEEPHLWEATFLSSEVVMPRLEAICGSGREDAGTGKG